MLALLTVNNILLWVLIISIIGFGAMGADKAMAVSDRGRRISEKTLWLTGLAGGFPGIIAGAEIFRHKTRKIEFWPPVV